MNLTLSNAWSFYAPGTFYVKNVYVFLRCMKKL